MKENAATGKNSNTFIVKVVNDQNESWQGSVTWADTNEKRYFRSALELLQMMNEVIEGNMKGE